MSEVIGGLNPVIEALRVRGAAVKRVYLAEGRGVGALTELLNLARANGVGVQRVPRAFLDRLNGHPNHQGVVAQVGPYQYLDFDELLERSTGERALLLAMDSLEDPMNLGSLLRSAEAAGATGAIITRERAAPVTNTAMKAAAGAAEHLPVSRVVNLARTLEELKAAGFWTVGLDAAAPNGLHDHAFNPRTVVVVGGEDRGLRRLVREKCDALVSIPMAGRMSSLNAAVAGAVAMFEYVRQMRGTAK